MSLKRSAQKYSAIHKLVGRLPHLLLRSLTELLREGNGQRGQQQNSRSAANKFHHSITSSALTKSVGGTVNPSALAVFRLMTSSNLVLCWTGRSAGLVPLRIFPT